MHGLHDLFSFVQTTRLFRRFHPYSQNAKTCIRADGDARFARFDFSIALRVCGKGESDGLLLMMVRFRRPLSSAVAASDEKLKRASQNCPMGQLTYTAAAQNAATKPLRLRTGLSPERLQDFPGCVPAVRELPAVLGRPIARRTANIVRTSPDRR